jgi:multimeric flavodoxin WrbA
MGDYILADRAIEGCDFLVTSRIRRCNGCSTCITSARGSCSQPDPLSQEIPRILGSDTLVIVSGVESDMIKMPMRKAVERLSNILLAFTDAGWNVPLDKDTTSLRKVVIEVDSGRNEGFEHYMKEMLLKGPVETMEFRYGE